MTEQLSIGGAMLPDAFVDAYREAERASGVRGSSVLEAVQVERSSYGRWTVIVRVDGREYALFNRADVAQAGRDLSALVTG